LILIRLNRKIRSKFFVFFFVTLLAAGIIPIYSLFAAFPMVKAAREPLSLKWSVEPGNASTMYGALAAKLIPGREGLQLVITGGADPITEDYTAQGDVLALDGSTGEVLWRASGYHMGTHNPFQIVDLDADNNYEIIISGRWMLGPTIFCLFTQMLMAMVILKFLFLPAMVLTKVLIGFR
jgi:hypothetical protein